MKKKRCSTILTPLLLPPCMDKLLARRRLGWCQVHPPASTACQATCSLYSIGSYAFQKCSQLESITIPFVNHDGDCFFMCTSDGFNNHDIAESPCCSLYSTPSNIYINYGRNDCKYFRPQRYFFSLNWQSLIRISAMQCFSTYLTFFLYKYKYIYYLCKISICYHKRNCCKYNKDT